MTLRRTPKLPAASGKERTHVLFVDDEPMLAELAKVGLGGYGFTITATTSANDALEIYKNNPDIFDVVVTDHTMPEMTGLELASHILATTPDMPIILCSGHSAMVPESTIQRIGIRKYVFKPLSIAALATFIGDAVDATTEND